MHAHAVAEKCTHSLARFPQQTLILKESYQVLGYLTNTVLIYSVLKIIFLKTIEKLLRLSEVETETKEYILFNSKQVKNSAIFSFKVRVTLQEVSTCKLLVVYKLGFILSCKSDCQPIFL